jgi:PIN domain nuclease of toxin-antitoxin system
LALPAGSIASERDRLSGTPLWSTKKSRTATAGVDDSAAINKLIANINAGAKANKARMLRIIIINTDVAGSTLEQEKSRTGLSLGDVYVAHSLAMASHKSFNQIIALKAKGQTWAKIAQMHNISLRGSTAALKEMLKE